MCGPAPKTRRSPRLAADVEAVGIGVVAFVAVAGPIDHDRPEPAGSRAPSTVPRDVPGEEIGESVRTTSLTTPGVKDGSSRTRSHCSGCWANSQTALLIAKTVVSRLGPM